MDTDDLPSTAQSQVEVNRAILERYLEQVAVAVSANGQDILYIDAFSGTPSGASGPLEEALPSLALRRLRNVKDDVLRTQGRRLRLRAVFFEMDPVLAGLAADQTDIEITVINQEFEHAIPAVLDLIRAAGPAFAPLILLGPARWSGLALTTVTPLLCLPAAELLISVSARSLLRAGREPRSGLGSGLEGLFGDSSFRSAARGLKGRAREDTLVFEYARRVAETGRFRFSPIAFLPAPGGAPAHSHVIGATRSDAVLQAFKDAEKRALKLAGESRAETRRRDREARTSQPELLSGRDVPETDYVRELEIHYAGQAKKKVYQLLLTKRDLPFDEIGPAALQFPTVELASVRKWIQEIADFAGLGPRDRTAKFGCGHRVTLRDGKGQTAELDFSA